MTASEHPVPTETVPTQATGVLAPRIARLAAPQRHAETRDRSACISKKSSRLSVGSPPLNPKDGCCHPVRN